MHLARDHELVPDRANTPDRELRIAAVRARSLARSGRGEGPGPVAPRRQRARTTPSQRSRARPAPNASALASAGSCRRASPRPRCARRGASARARRAASSDEAIFRLAGSAAAGRTRRSAGSPDRARRATVAEHIDDKDARVRRRAGGHGLAHRARQDARRTQTHAVRRLTRGRRHHASGPVESLWRRSRSNDDDVDADRSRGVRRRRRRDGHVRASRAAPTRRFPPG